MSTSDILVRFGADIGPLTKGSKDAARHLKTFENRVGDVTRRVKQVTAVIAAAGVATGVFTAQALNSARELDNLARVAGTTSSILRQMSFGSEQLGISQEKLSDIIKDVNDRIGDFIQTGGGPMADFFENIAPKVGVTADQFARLSGPEALQLYVSSLEKANLSQADMTFYMETMASDSTMLLPLLRENGKLMNQQAEAATALGYALSDVDYATMVEARAAITQVGGAIIGVRDQFVAELSPTITAVANQITKEFITAGGGLRGELSGAVDFGVNKFADLVDGAAGIADFIEQNQTMASFGLLGYLVLGKKGLAVGGAIGIIFEQINSFAERYGIGISDAEHNLNRIADLNVSIASKMADVAWQEEQINNLKAAGIHVSSLEEAMIQDQKNELAGMIEIRNRLSDEQAKSLTAEEELEEWLIKNTDSAEGLAGSMRNVAQAMRDSLVDQGGEDESSAPSMTDMAEEDAAGALDAQRRYQSQASSDYQLFLMRRGEMAQAELERQRQIESDRQTMLTEGGKALSNLAGMMESTHRGMFEVGKAAAISQTVIDTYASAQASFKALAGIPIVGPGLGAAAAGAAILGGLSRVQSISSRSFNKSGASGGSGAAGSQASSAASTQGAQAQAGPQRSLLVQGDFDSSSLFTGEAVRGLIDRIAEAQADGYTVTV